MEKELGKSRAELEKLNTKLHNPGFVNKAPANVVEPSGSGPKSLPPSITTANSVQAITAQTTAPIASTPLT